MIKAIIYTVLLAALIAVGYSVYMIDYGMVNPFR